MSWKKISPTISYLRCPEPALVEAVLQLSHGLPDSQIALLPDAHPGVVPNGMVVATDRLVPKLIGNDIGCGMLWARVEGISKTDLEGGRDTLIKELRRSLFEGGRKLPIGAKMRQGLLQEGIPGLLEALQRRDSWQLLGDFEASIYDSGGYYPVNGLHPCFEKWMEVDTGGFDDQLGNLGGGNHFLELATLSDKFDSSMNFSPQDVFLVVHSGSLGFGHMVSRTIQEYPEGEWMSLLGQTAHFTMANRLALALAANTALREALGREVSLQPLTDSPHNLIWIEDGWVIHRKGASRAQWDQTVLVPGSLQSGTAILAGLGEDTSWSSSAHGAGRRLSRGTARQLDPPNPLPVLPVDLEAIPRRIRDNLLPKIAEEAPEAYNNLDEIVDCLTSNQLARRTGHLHPFLSAKSF